MSSIPTRKVGAGAVAGAVTGILIWVGKAFGGVEVPGEVGSYLTTILTLITSYFVADPE